MSLIQAGFSRESIFTLKCLDPTQAEFLPSLTKAMTKIIHIPILQLFFVPDYYLLQHLKIKILGS